MDVLRVVDAYCASCDDIRPHAILSDDTSSCFCNGCGTCQALVSPLANVTSEESMDHLAARRCGSRPRPGEIWFSGKKAPADPVDRPGRVDVWSRDNVLAGIALLAEALETQEDPDMLREGIAWIRRSAAGAQDRRRDASTPDTSATRPPMGEAPIEA